MSRDVTDMEARRIFHRPKHSDEMRAAVFELRSRGMCEHDIARATDLSVEAVRRLLGEVK